MNKVGLVDTAASVKGVDASEQLFNPRPAYTCTGTP